MKSHRDLTRIGELRPDLKGNLLSKERKGGQNIGERVEGGKGIYSRAVRWKGVSVSTLHFKEHILIDRRCTLKKQ